MATCPAFWPRIIAVDDSCPAALTGDIHGIVVDPQNLPVEGAQVTLTNQATAVARVAITDASGSFSQLQLMLVPTKFAPKRPAFKSTS